MQRLEVSGAVRPIYGSLGVKRLTTTRNSERNVCENAEFVAVHQDGACRYDWNALC